MTIDQWVATFSATVSFLGFLMVIVQLRENNQQAMLESQIRLYDMTRKLISLGFFHPELFETLKGGGSVKPAVEQHYLQLWLNQFSLIHSFKENGAFQKDVGESFYADFRAMMTMPSMVRQWQRFGKHYPASFQKAVTDILHEAGQNEVRSLKN